MKKEIHLPLSEAFQISLENIWKRQTRSLIVITSTALGISYLTYFLSTNVIYSTSLVKAGISVEAYHLWLVVISIFVCGVSLVNSTMISVLERYKEIGTMKCLGALDQHILRLLIIEALIFGLAGGLAGFTLGIIVSLLSSSFELGFGILQRLPLLGLLELFAAIMGLSIVLSVVATAYPAFRAARLNPVEALHYDV